MSREDKKAEVGLFDFMRIYYELHESRQVEKSAIDRQLSIWLFLDELFEKLKKVEPSSFNQEVSNLITTELDKTKNSFEDDEQHFIYLSFLSNFFRDLYYYIQNEEKAFCHVVQQLVAQCDPSFYDERHQDKMENFSLTAEAIPAGMLGRLSNFCELTVGDIYKRFNPGEQTFFMKPKRLDSAAQNSVISFTHHASKGELVAMLDHCNITMTIKPHDTIKLNYPSVKLPKKLSFRQKWQRLSKRQKLKLAGFIFLAAALTATLAVVVPGSELVTVPGAGILTAKALAVMLGTGAIIGAVTYAAVKVKNNDIEINGDEQADDLENNYSVPTVASTSKVRLSSSTHLRESAVDDVMVGKAADIGGSMSAASSASSVCGLFFEAPSKDLPRVDSSTSLSSVESDGNDFMSMCDQAALGQGEDPAWEYVGGGM